RLCIGTVELIRQWHVLEEVVGSALARLRRELARHTARVDIPGDLPLLSLDGVLMEQVFFNLLENAARYTPAGSRIEITARIVDNRVEIRVSDNGPGLPMGSESRVFERFFRGSTVSPDRRPPVPEVCLRPHLCCCWSRTNCPSAGFSAPRWPEKATGWWKPRPVNRRSSSRLSSRRT